MIRFLNVLKIRGGGGGGGAHCFCSVCVSVCKKLKHCLDIGHNILNCQALSFDMSHNYVELLKYTCTLKYMTLI